MKQAVLDIFSSADRQSRVLSLQSELDVHLEAIITFIRSCQVTPVAVSRSTLCFSLIFAHFSIFSFQLDRALGVIVTGTVPGCGKSSWTPAFDDVEGAVTQVFHGDLIASQFWKHVRRLSFF